MTSDLKAELVSIGTEILLGEITDTNSVFLARTLRDIGVNVYYMMSVGDNKQRIADIIRTSLTRSDIVITCGGLGPTVDDMTRDGVAAAVGRKLVFDKDLLDMIAARFEKYRVTMTDNNRRQAYLPEGALPIPNPVGTAPAFAVEVGDKVVLSLPGVPREMKYLTTEWIIPYLRDRYQITDQVILARILKTGGIGESTLDTMLGADLLNMANPTIGLAAHSGQIDVRITAKADTRLQAETMIADVADLVRARVGDYIFGVDDEQLEATFATLLRSQNATLAVSETGVDRIIYKRLAEPMGKMLAHAEDHDSPAALQSALGLSEAIPLQDMAEATAKSLLDKATVAIAIVSRPEVDENKDTEAGTAVVVCTSEKCRQRVYGFGGRNENVRQFVGNWSLAVAWRLTKELVDAT